MDIFGGGPSGGGGDMFGNMQAPAAPSFPAYIAYEDAVLNIGFNFRREMGAPNNHTISAIFANKTSGPIENVSIQVAAQKYMVLKIQPPSGSSLGPMA